MLRNSRDILISPKMRTICIIILMALVETYLEIFVPILAPIKLEIIATGIIEYITSPSANFEKKAKAA